MAERAALNEDFRDMLEALLAGGVEFVVVGAHALAAQGIIRATGDMDLLVRPSPDNAVRVVAALQRFGARLEVHQVSAVDFAAPGLVYQIGVPPRRIDLLTDISGVSFEDAWASRVEVESEGLRLPVLGRDSLIANKRAAGRPKDLLDVESLLRAAPPATGDE